MADTLALLPCPFCGWQPTRDNVQVKDQRPVLVCGKCGARAGHTAKLAKYGGHDGMLKASCFDAAITAWNRRSDHVRDAALAACQAFVDRFDSGQGLRADTDHVADLMRAAIKRAKGKT